VGQIHLHSIARAQSLYLEQHGRYGSLQELTGGEKPVLDPWIVTRGPFDFEITLTGDAFTAIVRQKATGRAWQVGPDGEVRPLK